jgi:DNA modification methylase
MVNELIKKKIKEIIKSTKDKRLISGKSHTFYRYPAAFSPFFAETIIENFTKPGDIILDPFVGGGTSAVEALALQRKFYGVDVNPLSILISKVKTTILSQKKLIFIKSFNKKIINGKINFKSKRKKHHKHLNHYFNTKNFSKDEVRKINQIKSAIEQYHFAITKIRDVKVRNFLTCLLLKTSKNILDNTRPCGSFKKFKIDLLNNCEKMLKDMIDFEKELEITKSIYSSHSKVKIIKSDILKLNKINSLKKGTVKLILTSPPYPGIHISYNKWQIHGRRDTKLPYWIMNSKPPAFTKFSYRGEKARGLNDYYSYMTKVYLKLKPYCSDNCHIVKLLSFRNKAKEFKLYRDAMENAGLEEIKILKKGDGRIWRTVPKRRWQARYSKKKLKSNKEVLLIYKYKSGVISNEI